MNPDSEDPGVGSMSNIIFDLFKSTNNQCTPTIPTVISILIITGCLCVLAYRHGEEKSRNWRKKNRSLARSTSIGLLRGGKLAIQRLIDYHNILEMMEKLDEVGSQLKTLLAKPELDLKALQSVIGKLEMSGKEEAQAIELLKQAQKKAEELQKRHEAYELQMLIVEMLIYQGKHREALDCECLYDEEISDARRPLYKAIIGILEGDNNSAKKFWEKFKEIREHFKTSYDIEGPVSDIPNNFDKFATVVNTLKKEIRDAKGTTKINQLLKHD